MCDELKIGLRERNFEKKIVFKNFDFSNKYWNEFEEKNEKNFSPNFPSTRFYSLWSSQTLTASVGVKELGRPLFKNAT